MIYLHLILMENINSQHMNNIILKRDITRDSISLFLFKNKYKKNFYEYKWIINVQDLH